MILADTGFAEYGPLGLIVILLAGWLTFLGKWVIGKFVTMIGACTGVIQRNTDAMENRNHDSAELTKALNGFTQASAECRQDHKEMLRNGRKSE